MRSAGTWEKSPRLRVTSDMRCSSAVAPISASGVRMPRDGAARLRGLPPRDRRATR